MAEPPHKKFRYTTYSEQIKNISVDAGKHRGSGWNKEEYDEDTEQSITPFTAEIERLSLLDLTVPYQDIQRTLLPLTTTIPITLHNLPEIGKTFHEFYTNLNEGQEHTHSGLDSALRLHQALYETCLGEALAYIPQTIEDLLRVGALRALDPKLVERTYSTLSLILRTIASSLLKPSAQSTLRQTWTNIHPFLGKGNKQYVRRCVADAWVGVIRKARSEGLARLMALLLEDDVEGMEAVWAHSMEGASGQLHSRGLAIYTALLDHMVNNPYVRPMTTLCLVSTALVHHTSVTTIQPVVEVVLDKLVPSSPIQTSTSILNVLATFLFTRKGKRFPEALLKPIMQKFQSLVPLLASEASVAGKNLPEGDVERREEWRKALVTGIVGSLQAGQLKYWLSPGVGLIESLWSNLDDQECFSFVNALVALKWAGVEQFILFHVAKASLPSLESDPLSTIILLNNLASAGYLSGGLVNVQGGRWRQTLVAALVKLLGSVGQSKLELTERRILGQALSLLPALPSDAETFVPGLMAILKSTLERLGRRSEDELKEEWKESGAWNDSHVLGCLLRVTDDLVTSPKADVEEVVKELLVTRGWVKVILEKWSWNREVMQAAVPHVDRWASDLQISHDNMLQRITPNLSSSDSSLRLSSLQILSALAPSSPLAPNPEECSTSLFDIYNLCVQIESSEMTLRNVRERTTNISRLSRVIVALPVELPEGVLSAVIVYLAVQFKVNFQPVYPEAVAALATISEKYKEQVWETIWSELQLTNSATAATVRDLEWEEPEWTKEKVEDDRSEDRNEEEAEFRCPNLEKSKVAFARVWGRTNQENKLDLHEIAAQVSRDRLDVLNYEAQLLVTLMAIPSVAEKHTRLLVPVMFSVARQGTSEDDEPRSATHLSTKQLQGRTANYLELFSKFVNPKAAFRSDELYQLYLDIISKGETKLQGLALQCLLTYKSPAISTYAEPLEHLLIDSKFRDELSRMRLGIDSQDYALATRDSEASGKIRVVSIEPTHREEAMPVIIRLLYGIITSRRGRSSSSQGQSARRQAVLSALSGCAESELGVLVDLMLEPFGNDKSVSGKQQMGFLGLLTDVIRYLGPQLGKNWARLVSTTISMVAKAQERLTASNVVTEDIHEGQEDAEDMDVEKGLAPLRNIRSIGLKRLVQFLRSPVEFDVKPYLVEIFHSIITPRLDKLEIENTQAPSGTLDMIAALVSEPSTAKMLTELDDRTLPKTFACMTAIKVKPAVVLRVFDVIDSLLVDEGEDDDEGLTQDVLLPHIRVLIDHIIGLVATLKASQNDDITRRLLGILARLSAIVHDGQQAQQLATLLAPMLRNRQTPEKAKTHILSSLRRLYAISPDFADPSSKFFYQSYDLISSLFQTLYFSSSRRALVSTLETFAVADNSLEKSINLVGKMNAYSTKRMEEPDFDRRLGAYEAINDAIDGDLPQGTRAWAPILRSALFFLNEPEELSIRTSASAVLQRFISLTGDDSEGQSVEVLRNMILPGLKRAIKSKLELVRNEALLVVAHAVKTCGGLAEFTEMRPLLAEGDDEASFFTNITHIQVHRRTRALVRLRNTVADPATSIGEANLTSIFLPILEHVIAGATDVTDHHLINEAIQSVGGLAKDLRWSKWYALIGRYMKLGMGSKKSAQQKYYVRSVAAVIDGFHFDLEEAMTVDGVEENGEVVDEEGVDEDEDEDVTVKAPEGTSPAKITAIIINRLLPSLSKFVADKDDTDSAVRVPLALGVVKIAHALPRSSSDTEVLRVITSVAQILRSRDQDTRDITRETVCKIAIYLGPEWLVRVIKELELALPRGPQKHVLAVTTHAILVQATSQAADRFSDLDVAVELSVQIAAEVIWGESGKDVETEGFKTKMREVRGATSRGFDTFQILAQLVSPGKIGAVLNPLREIMHASQAVKAMQQIDEALRRVSLGLNSNRLLEAQDMISLCHSLISGNSSYLKAKRKAVRPTETPDAFKVVMKRDSVKVEENLYAANAHKLVIFGLDLFVTAFRRGKFDFDDVNILARLGPMVNAIGNTLYSPIANVLLLSLKATAAIARCPIPQVEPALHVFVSNIFKIIKHAGGSAESEVAQTALKTLSVILRDCKASEVTENQLRYLIEVISPDVEEPDRQSAIFTILRAIITRRFVVPEIYDLMERVSSIMVTSQSTHVQELCRGSVMAFLLDYPQGKGRLKSQMTFFAQNLQYTYESGRLSVMEVLSAVFDKFSEALIEEYAGMFFVALVVVRANDDSEKCRVAAGELLKLLWRQLGDDERTKMAAVVKGWVGKRDENETLAGAAMGVLGLLVETGEEGLGDVASVVEPVLEESAATLQDAEEEDEAVELDFTLPHQTLSTTAKLVLAHPSLSSSLPWPSIVPHLLFPHDYVRYDTAKLIANLFASDADTGVICEMLGPELCLDIARKCCLVLKASRGEDGQWAVVSGKLADQVVKVLYNLSKNWATSEKPVSAHEAETVEGDEQDEEETVSARRPLAWLMSRMSFIARHLIVNRPAPNSHQSLQPWSLPIMSILRFFAGVTECLSKEQATGFLVHILNPVYRILDEGGDLGQVEEKQVDELRELATQIREFVQAKTGSTAFSRSWENIRQSTQAKRQGRRDDRIKLAYTNPEKFAERKGKKVERAKEGKKRKNNAFNEGRKVKKRK